MPEEQPRFRSVEAAIRFYLRAEEILSAKSSLKLSAEANIRETGRRPREDLMMDFLTVATALKRLTPLQLWLLRSLYTPVRFGERRRTITRACEEGRKRFPNLRWTPQGLGRLRRQTLDALEERLCEKKLLEPKKLPDSGRFRRFSGQNEVTYGLTGYDGQGQRASRLLTSDPRYGPRKPRRRHEVTFDATPKGN